MGSCNSNSSISSEGDFKIVNLPDGSTIYLNKHSSVSYPQDFSENRNIDLEGEGYFIVSKSPQPFTINTAHGSILITGTKLNVESTDEMLVIEVDEGTVEVITKNSKKILKKGQRAVKKASTELRLEKVQGKFNHWIKQLDKELKKEKKALEKGVDKTEKKLKKLVR